MLIKATGWVASNRPGPDGGLLRNKKRNIMLSIINRVTTSPKIINISDVALVCELFMYMCLFHLLKVRIR